MKAYFDSKITAKFYALKEDGCEPQEMDDNVTIYLFDKYPTSEEATDGTNSIQQVTAWTNTDDSFGKQWMFNPIKDPDPAIREPNYDNYSDNNFRTDDYYYEDNCDDTRYYYVVNATKEGESVGSIVRELRLCRLKSQESRLICNVSDLIKRDPNIKEFCHCLGDLDLYIESAIEDIKMSLNGCCTNWADILNPEELKRAVVYQSLADFYFGQRRGVNSPEYSQAIRFEDKVKYELKRVFLKIDKYGTGKPAKTKASYSRSVRILR